MNWNGSYWGLTRHIGPFTPTSEDARRANSRAGGPHAGNGNWMQTFNPSRNGDADYFDPEQKYKYVGGRPEIYEKFNVNKPFPLVPGILKGDSRAGYQRRKYIPVREAPVQLEERGEEMPNAPPSEVPPKDFTPQPTATPPDQETPYVPPVHNMPLHPIHSGEVVMPGAYISREPSPPVEPPGAFERVPEPKPITERFGEDRRIYLGSAYTNGEKADIQSGPSTDSGPHLPGPPGPPLTGKRKRERTLLDNFHRKKKTTDAQTLLYYNRRRRELGLLAESQTANVNGLITDEALGGLMMDSVETIHQANLEAQRHAMSTDQLRRDIIHENVALANARFEERMSGLRRGMRSRSRPQRYGF